MRAIAAVLVCVCIGVGAVVGGALLAGGGRSSPLTAEQQQQVDDARAATVATSEHTLGRALTERERQCIRVGVKDGCLVGNIAPPLSDRLKAASQLTHPETFALDTSE